MYLMKKELLVKGKNKTKKHFYNYSQKLGENILFRLRKICRQTDSLGRTGRTFVDGGLPRLTGVIVPELHRDADDLSFPEIIKVVNDCHLLKCIFSLEDQC
jgi:hypothetical protein